MGAGVQPGVSALHDLNIELALIKIDLVDRCDFQFAARAGLDRLGNVDHRVVVKVQAGDREIALGLERLFLDFETIFVKLNSI